MDHQDPSVFTTVLLEIAFTPPFYRSTSSNVGEEEWRVRMDSEKKLAFSRPAYKQMRAWAKMHRKRYVNIKGNCVQDRRCFPGISR